MENRHSEQTIVKPAGRTNGHWTEYEETPYMHATGYFWLRPDGLRFGYRLAGRYYRPGTKPVPVDEPYHPLDYPANHPKRGRPGQWWPSGSYADGAVAFDVLGAMREEGKMEQLPAHLRVMKDGQEIELISKIDGVNLEVVLAKDDFDPFEFIDKRFPIQRTVDAKTEKAVKPKETKKRK